MPLSRITGQSYCGKSQANTWHNNLRYKQAHKLSTMFDFPLCAIDTEDNLKSSVEKLRHMYHDQKISNSDFVKMFNWKSKYFTNFLEALGIARMGKSEALKNWAKTHITPKTDEKHIYWDACKFQFIPYSETKIMGFELLLIHGIYHQTLNPDGMTRDHMYSIFDGWRNAVDPKIISHPANCQFMSHSSNSSKNNSSSISLLGLKTRIAHWDKLKPLSPFVSITSPKFPTSEATKQKIREWNVGKKYFTNGKKRICVARHQPVPDGYWPLTPSNTTRLDRIFNRKSKWDHIDWEKMQQDINLGANAKDLKLSYGITSDGLHWAKNAGLITAWYVKVAYESKFPWHEISVSLDRGDSISNVCQLYSISKHQIMYAKQKKLL
jgi:hypothetical protein